ncbi:hypothetical protein [Spongorhabdus nitratireducens]
MMYCKTRYIRSYTRFLLLCFSLTFCCSYAATSQVFVSRIPLTYFLKAHLICSSEPLSTGVPVVSEEFDYLGRKATLYIYPAGTTEDQEHVGVELRVTGKYTEELSPYVSSLIIETRREHCLEESNQAVAFQQATILESPEKECFVVKLTSLIPITDIDRRTNEALFTIRPQLRGCISAEMERRQCIVKWQIPRHDIAMAKRGDFFLVSPDVEIKSSSVMGNGPLLRMELGNKEKYPSLNHITFRVHQDEGASKLPFSSYEFLYEGPTSEISLATGSWKESQQNCIDLEKTVGYPFNIVLAPTYKDVLSNCKPGPTVTFILRLKRRAQGSPAALIQSEKQFSELLDLAETHLSAVPSGSRTEDQSGLIFVNYIGDMTPVSAGAVQSSAFPFHGRQYVMSLNLGDDAAHPGEVVLTLTPEAQATPREQPPSSTSQPQLQNVSLVQEVNTGTGTLRGVISTHHRITAKHELEKAAEKAAPVYTPLPTALPVAGQPYIKMSVLPVSHLSKGTGLAEFVLRPVYCAAIVSTIRQASDTTETPFITPVMAGVDYTLDVRRFDMSLLGHCDNFTIGSADVDSGIKFELKPNPRNPSMLVMVVSNYPEDEDHGDFTVWYDMKSGRKNIQRKLFECQQSDIQGGEVSLQLATLESLMSSANGETVRFTIKTNRKQEATN